MVEAYNRLPDDVKTQIADLRARHSIEASLRRRHADREAPGAPRAVSRTPSIRSCARIPETGEKVLFVNAFTTHFTNYHTPENVRFGQDCNPGASQLLNYLISQAFVPEFQVRFRWSRTAWRCGTTGRRSTTR